MKKEKKVLRSKLEEFGMDELWCMWYVCPICGSDSITWSFKYCPDCGVNIIHDDEPTKKGN